MLPSSETHHMYFGQKAPKTPIPKCQKKSVKFFIYRPGLSPPATPVKSKMAARGHKMADRVSKGAYTSIFWHSNQPLLE